MVKVRELFRDKESTEFVIVTIPTVLNNFIIVISHAFLANDRHELIHLFFFFFFS